MFRKLAVALIAATVFTAPVLAQSTAPANPPIKTDATPTTTAPVAATTPATPKVVAAKPTLKTAKVRHVRHLAHHRVKHVKYAKHGKKHIKLAKHVKHIKFAKKAKHHVIAKLTRKSHKGATYMRSASATHPAAVKIKKPLRHTLKTTHRINHVRVAQKSTTHARTDAPSAPKSVN